MRLLYISSQEKNSMYYETKIQKHHGEVNTYRSNLKMVTLHVVVVVIHYIHTKPNLKVIVDGQVLINVFQIVLKQKVIILWEWQELKYYAINVMDIWDMYF